LSICLLRTYQSIFAMLKFEICHFREKVVDSMTMIVSLVQYIMTIRDVLTGARRESVHTGELSIYHIIRSPYASHFCILRNSFIMDRFKFDLLGT
jgi:hypothetical protein